MESGTTTLANLLKGGKIYSCDEALYVLSKLVKQFSIFQENKIANGDVKASNIILIDDPKNQNPFLYKVSDFGVGYLDKEWVNSSFFRGCTIDYAAPEVKKIKSNTSNEGFNPYISDVYSLGLMVLKMIKCHKIEKILSDYDYLKQILMNMLEKNPIKRYDFKKLNIELDNLTKGKLENFEVKDEKKYHLIWLEQHEIKVAKTTKGLINLYNENMIKHKNKKMFRGPDSYSFNCRLKIEPFWHLEKAWNFLEKLKKEEPNYMYDLLISKFNLKNEELQCLIELGNFFITSNAHIAEKYINKALKLCNINFKNQKPHEKLGNDNFLGELYKKFGLLYAFTGNYELAKLNFKKSLESNLKHFGEFHPDTAIFYNNLGLLCMKRGKLEKAKAKKYFLKALEINQKYEDWHEFTKEEKNYWLILNG